MFIRQFECDIHLRASRIYMVRCQNNHKDNGNEYIMGMRNSSNRLDHVHMWLPKKQVHHLPSSRCSLEDFVG